MVKVKLCFVCLFLLIFRRAKGLPLPQKRSFAAKTLGHAQTATVTPKQCGKINQYSTNAKCQSQNNCEVG